MRLYMNNELISIIVPIYNTEAYLEKCINSIINQTYKDLEIILVNDGSPDNSLKICEKYANIDKRIKIIDKENGGLSSARNAGLEIATGKYIGFVDSDDYIENDMFETLYSLIKSEEADISMVSYKEYRNNLVTRITGEDNKIITFNKLEALKKLLINIEIENYVWNKLFKSELFKEIRFPDGENYEDIVTTIKLFGKANKLIYKKTPKYNYIKRNNSIVNSFNYKAIKDYYTATVERYNYLLEKAKEIQDYNALAFISNMIIVYRIAVTKDVKELYRDFMNEFNLFNDLVQKYSKTIFENIGNYKRVILSIILWDLEYGKEVVKTFEEARMKKMIDESK